MNTKTWATLGKLFLGVILCGMTGNALAAGALAIDGNAGGTYGWAVAQESSNQAAELALNRCGIGCQIVMRFETGCGAYAIDLSMRSTVSGWSMAATGPAAQNRAMTECMLHGGRSCVVRVWGCN
jgi:hypothetical protein